MLNRIKHWLRFLAITVILSSGQSFAQQTKNYVGFWWNPSESGWGLSVQQQGINVFALWYTYDAAGKPIWHSLNCNMNGNNCEGDLYTGSGLPFAQITAGANNATIKSGTASLSTTTDGKLSLSYSVGAITQNKTNLARLDIATTDQIPVCKLQSGSRATATNYTDLWWGDANAAGWGIQITHQANKIFMGWYTYNDSGTATWLTGDATQDPGNPKRFTGSIYQVANGTPFDKISGVAAGPVATIGTFELIFTNGEQGKFTYSLPSYSVATRSLPIIRFAIASGDTNLCTPPPAGTSNSVLDELSMKQNYRAGGNDAAGKLMGGTELNFLLPFAGKLFALNGYWRHDTTRADQFTGPQILVKDSANGAWHEEYRFDKSIYYSLEAAAVIRFTTDGTGKKLDRPATVFMVSPAPIAEVEQTGTVWTRNDDATWTRTIVGAGLLNARVLFDHVDTVTGVHMVLAGMKDGLVVRGVYDAAVPGRIKWDSAPEFVSASSNRVQTGVVANKVAHVASAPEVGKPGGLFRRVDGASPKWELAYTWQTQRTENNGMRGLTAVPDPKGGSHEVILAAREEQGVIERIDPLDGYKSVVEFDIRAYYTNLWSGLSGSTSLAAYNDMAPMTDPKTGEPVHLIGLWVSHPNPSTPPNNGSNYLVRHRDGRYEAGVVNDPANPLPEGSALRGTRTIVASPFAEDAGRVAYFGGYDAAGVPKLDTAWIYRGEWQGGRTTPAKNCKGTGVKPKQTIRYKSVAGVNPNLLSLDLYEPIREAGCPPAPIVVFAHGGGYRQGDKAFQIADKIRLFTGEGWAFASINYRLSPDPSEPTNPDRIKYPIHQQDAASAFAWLLKNAAQFNGDPSQLLFVGHSAGAHLVSIVSTDQTFMQAEGFGLKDIVCTASLDTETYDVVDLINNTDRADTLWINAFSADRAVQAQASPINNVSAGKAIPAFLAFTRADAYRVRQTNAFITKLTQAGVSAKVLSVDPYTHEEVNDALGQVGDTLVTPPLMRFFRGCVNK
jgi:arylformamidase